MPKMTPRLLPHGWEQYWDLRMQAHIGGNSLNYLYIPEAKQEMINAGYEGFRNLHPYELRQLEMYTIANLPCECFACLRYLLDEPHRVPYVILKAEYYNRGVLEDMQDAQ